MIAPSQNLESAKDNPRERQDLLMMAGSRKAFYRIPPERRQPKLNRGRFGEAKNSDNSVTGDGLLFDNSVVFPQIVCHQGITARRCEFRQE